ncbi:MAG: TIGR03435 family protein [Acidobacteriota bacterium]
MSGRYLLLFLTGLLPAQTTPRLEFEVATVRSSLPPQGDLIHINLGTVRNGRVTFANASLSDCLKFAYGIVSSAQISGPDWITSKAVRFDIVAQAPAGVPREQLQKMLQTLLADRLKLVLHHEQKDLPFLALVPGRNGPKLHEAKPDSAGSADNVAVRPHIPGYIHGDKMSMEFLATLLSRFQRETVVNMTGLNGLFEVKLEWTPDDGRAVTAPTDIPDGPSIFTAVQEQLGLRLETRKGPLDVLVVDHAEQVPAEN